MLKRIRQHRQHLQQQRQSARNVLQNAADSHQEEKAPAAAAPVKRLAPSRSASQHSMDSHASHDHKPNLNIELAKKEVIIKLQADSLVEANEQIRQLLEQMANRAEIYQKQDLLLKQLQDQVKDLEEQRLMQQQLKKQLQQQLEQQAQEQQQQQAQELQEQISTNTKKNSSNPDGNSNSDNKDDETIHDNKNQESLVEQLHQKIQSLEAQLQEERIRNSSNINNNKNNSQDEPNKEEQQEKLPSSQHDAPNNPNGNCNNLNSEIVPKHHDNNDCDDDNTENENDNQTSKQESQYATTADDKVIFLEATIQQLQLKVNEQESERTKLENIIAELTQFIETSMEDGVELPSPMSTSSYTAAHNSQRQQQSLLKMNSLHEETDESDSDDDDTAINDNPSLVSVGTNSLLSPTSLATAPSFQRHALPHGHKLLLLISSMPGDAHVSQLQRRIQTILQGLYMETPDHSEAIQLIDGCDPTLRQLRNDLFQISGCNAKYPQLFLVADNDLVFVGDGAALIDLHDQQLLPETLGLRVI